MEIFKKRQGILSLLKKTRDKEKESAQQYYIECEVCKEEIIRQEMKSNLYVCPQCGGYNYMPAEDRLDMILEEGYKRIEERMKFRNPIDYPDYKEIIEINQEKTGEKEALISATGYIYDQEVLLMVMDKKFIMASMGSYVGEKITLSFEYAKKKELPVIIYSASGGARMQEGMVSLMQMTKTSNAVREHSEEGLLYINVFTDPTTGGVTASFSSLSDIAIAEPNALIGFAGPRVIKQTIGQELPEGFQRAEFQLEHGFLDDIIERADQKDYLYRLLSLHG